MQQHDMYNPYAASVVEEDDIEFELAGPWQRINARVIDSLIFLIPISPILIGIALDNETMSIALSALGGLGILALFVYQLVIMAKYGQSIGKKAMKIRVITEDGDNPGFWRYVGLREFVFNIILSIIALIPFVGSFVNFGAQIACLVMLFLEKSNRRTLQDMLAKTLVVKV